MCSNQFVFNPRCKWMNASRFVLINDPMQQTVFSSSPVMHFILLSISKCKYTVNERWIFGILFSALRFICQQKTLILKSTLADGSRKSVFRNVRLGKWKRSALATAARVKIKKAWLIKSDQDDRDVEQDVRDGWTTWCWSNTSEWVTSPLHTHS